MSSNLHLIQLDATWHAAFAAMADDYRAAGESRYDKAASDFAAFLAELVRARSPDQPPGFVPMDTYWLSDGAELLGSIRLRHRLLPHLEREGGHIGYDVRPSQRNRGYATQMLRLILPLAKARGLDRVLITCDADNLASARVIEKNGGRFQDQVTSEQTGKLVNRYWIEVVEPPQGVIKNQ